ncbi:TIGR02266 family protein [Hyalangium rubrum]|uniref:TIGR02266 family protein n=1 Tax=Hyalangium rubrum TaxID=3103134 RepID=A0ABU5H052_9BACT|nr:TIGR02266 family protein [Hyalangium sp. s54d21]MDY7226494.1 TIGR02266 family protein [Hyalangium sp. s54d21]
MPSNASPRPPMARESELARAESELGALENRLADQVARATTEATTLASRLTQVRAELARMQTEHSGDITLPEIGARLQAAAIPELAVESAREKALEARQQALEARRLATQDVQIALHAFQQQTTALTRELSEAESHLKQLTEAAARARREQEAARNRQAQQARAEATRARAPARAAPAPAASTSSSAREYARVRMQATISLGSDSNFFTGFSTDISSGGIFVATVETVPRGTTVDLDFTLPGGRPMKASGVVRWLREPNDRTPDLMPGVGVQFHELPAEVASVISDFVRKREPLFFPD